MIATVAGVLPRLIVDVPVDPDGDQARQWLIDELSKPGYQAAKPTLWDQLSKAFWDWLTSLQLPDGALQGPSVALLLLVVVVVIVTAFLLFGRPHRNRRSFGVGALFGEGEERTADELYRSASTAAAGGDWSIAIEELFRSIAKRMTERVLVSTNPGMTARSFASQAGEVFPEYADRIMNSATAFDGVRYLGQLGSELEYMTLVALENELRTTRPVSTGVTAL